MQLANNAYNRELDVWLSFIPQLIYLDNRSMPLGAFKGRPTMTIYSGITPEQQVYQEYATTAHCALSLIFA